MSEILNEFIIQPTEALFTVQPTSLIVNPEAIQLNVYTGAAPIAGGSNTNVQFNEDGVLQGSNSFTFNNVSNIVTIGNLAIGNVANLGGTSNVKIAGGTNGYVLQTDGTGNLSWTAQAGNVTGNGTPGGSNTQIQYNNSGNFGGSAGFTFDSVSNVVNVPGNLIAAGNITAPNFLGNATNANFASYAGYVVNGNQSNITALGLLANLSVAGTIAGNVISTTGDITSNANITANGQFVGNLSGTANLAITVTGNSQPNITSVGILTGLQVNGDINANANTIYANVVQANLLVGNISGNIIANVSNANYAAYAGNVVLSSQSNITSLGTLLDLRVNNASIHIGELAGETGQGNIGAVAIGQQAGRTNQSNTAVAIGQNAGTNAQGTSTVAIGAAAGSNNQVSGAIAIGQSAGAINQGNVAISVGQYAGGNAQSARAIAIGYSSASEQQGSNSIAIGAFAGYPATQHATSIVINATGANLNSAATNTFVVKPVRSTANNNILMYNTTSGEITYSTLSSYTDYLKTISTTVGALAAAATAGEGARAFVTDANLIASSNFGAIVGSGGANKAPVYSDGTNWRIG